MSPQTPHSTIDAAAVAQLRRAAERAVTMLQVLPPLVAHGLNEIWTQEEGCCPVCCGPCHSLATLARDGLLDDAVRPFVVETNGAGHDWWTGGAETGHVKRWALRKRWSQCPNHEGEHDERIASFEAAGRELQSSLDAALAEPGGAL